MRLLSRQWAVGSAIVSNPRQGDDITPTSPALAWAVRLRCSKALAGGLNGRLTHKAVI